MVAFTTDNHRGVLFHSKTCRVVKGVGALFVGRLVIGFQSPKCDRFKLLYRSCEPAVAVWGNSEGIWCFISCTGLLICRIEVQATDQCGGGVRETTRVFHAYSTLSTEVNMLSVHAILRCGIFIALPLLSSMLEADYQCRAVASQPQQNSEILSQIDSGLVSYINRVKTFLKVTFEAITNSGAPEIEVSSKDDNFTIVIRPISAEGHYTSNVYRSNKD